MFSEENKKENERSRDAYSNPLIKRDSQRQLNIKQFGSSDSEMIDSNFEFKSNNAPNVLNRSNNDSNSNQVT